MFLCFQLVEYREIGLFRFNLIWKLLQMKSITSDFRIEMTVTDALSSLPKPDGMFDLSDTISLLHLLSRTKHFLAPKQDYPRKHGQHMGNPRTNV